jgi:hypothetical protein
MYIRKVSIGPDYKAGAMHYVQGNYISKNSTDIIDTIQVLDDGSVKIWIKTRDGIVLWKEFNKHMPYSVEYNINL